MEITKEEFKAFEEVRESGRTNMCMVSAVCGYSGLEKEQVLAIIEDYEKLSEKYD